MEFNTEQTAAIESKNKNILVLAGAGSGKTRVITERTLRLIKSGIPSERILLLTFTRRAAAEMKARLRFSLSLIQTVNAFTFHLFCLRMLRFYPELFDLHELTVINRDDQIQLMKIARAEVAEKKEINFPKPAELINYFSYARNSQISLQSYLEKFTSRDDESIEKIKQATKIYQEHKSLNRYLDFDDILIRFAEKLAESDRTKNQICQRFDHVLVDEMQDTNPLQWKILDLLRNPANLFCVGDDAQSIYAFRGADFNNVHRFKDRIDGAEVLKLATNYRSKQKILDLANQLLSLSPLIYDKKLRAVRGNGKRPKFLEFGTKEEEAMWISDDILSKVNHGESLNEMMVLTRSAWSVRALEAACIRKKIPYQFIGGVSLFEGAHIKDLLSLCRIVANPKDQLAWLRFLTLFPKIGPRSALKFYSKINTGEINEKFIAQEMENLLKNPEISVGFLELSTLKNNPLEFLQKAIDLIGSVISGKYDYQESREKDFKLISDLSQKHRTIRRFLETYALDPITAMEATQTKPKERLTLITVHSAKGTESKICYMIQSGNGNYPHSRSLGSEAEIEEERRIMYVAITRAKNELLLTCSQEVNFFSGYTSYGTSPAAHCFLMQIPEELLESCDHEYSNT